MTAPVWSLVAGLDLQWRDLGESEIVFHPRSGLTHLLNATAAAALLLLAESPRDAASLARALSLPGHAPVPEDWMTQLLATFLDLGWVTSAPPEAGQP